MTQTITPSKDYAETAWLLAQAPTEAIEQFTLAHNMLHDECRKAQDAVDFFSDEKVECQIGEQDVCPHTCLDWRDRFWLWKWIREFGEENIHGYTQTCEELGFKELGRGCSRIAMLGPDGLVYKVERAHGRAKQCNRKEFDTYLSLSQQIAAEAFRLAECVLVEFDDEVVAVMPRVETMGESLTGAWYTDERVQAISRMDQLISDMHPGNWGVDSDGNIVVIDYGFGEVDG